MTTYEYSRIAKLAESLKQAGIGPEITEQIMEGGEALSTAGQKPCTFVFAVQGQA